MPVLQPGAGRGPRCPWAAWQAWLLRKVRAVTNAEAALSSRTGGVQAPRLWGGPVNMVALAVAELRPEQGSARPWAC